MVAMLNSPFPARSKSNHVAKAEASELIVDFVGGAVGHRFRSGEGRGQALAKAAGLVGGVTPDIVDATAGLGRDAFLLASLGARVTLIERSQKMHDLLTEGLARAAAEGGLYAETVARMTLLHGDSCQLLPTLKPQVVLVDPMHPPRGNSALVKRKCAKSGTLSAPTRIPKS